MIADCPECGDELVCQNAEFGLYKCHTCGGRYEEDELLSSKESSKAHKTRRVKMHRDFEWGGEE